MPPSSAPSEAPSRWYAAFRGRRVFITGGTGFLGNHLVRRLVALGADVTVAARAPINRSRIRDLARRIRLVEADVRKRRPLERAVRLSRPEFIFHLAAYGVDPRKRNPTTIIQTNVQGMVHLLEAADPFPYRRLVNTGTCFEYGQQKNRMSEQSALDPVNVYAASKTTAGQLCDLSRRQEGKPIVTLRPFTFFGPGERPDRLIPSVILSILQRRPIHISSGTQTRDYTYVEDMADAFLRAALAPSAVGEVINVGTGRDFAVREIAERIRRIMGSRVPLKIGAVQTRRDEVWRICCDNGKAKRLLGWKPRFTFEEAVHKTIRWFQKNGI